MKKIAVMPQVGESDSQDKNKNQGYVNLEFRVVANLLNFSRKQIKVKGKVHSGQKHKDSANRVDGGGIVGSHAGVLVAKAARSDSGKRM